ncbi:hypothetical protein DPEC_G00086940 [Dallia pectoralis]|uniref:Uncharacterized protein n=1 Tax=Dallia pectoralis TaxID=75939 RepID=A0ACC2H0R0_DALPE|nr:hypothetical protein DPEC_G00086940 [Dallia pectoralis]
MIARGYFILTIFIINHVVSLPLTPTSLEKDDVEVMKCIVKVLADVLSRPHTLPVSHECMITLRKDERLVSILRHRDFLRELQDIATQGTNERAQQHRAFMPDHVTDKPKVPQDIDPDADRSMLKALGGPGDRSILSRKRGTGGAREVKGEGRWKKNMDTDGELSNEGNEILGNSEERRREEDESPDNHITDGINEMGRVEEVISKKEVEEKQKNLEKHLSSKEVEKHSSSKEVEKPEEVEKRLSSGEVEKRLSSEEVEKYEEVEKHLSSEEVKPEEVAKPEEMEKRSSSEEVKKRSSSEEVKKRSSSEEVEKRSSSEEVEKRSSSEEVEKRSSSEEVEKRSSSKEVEKRSSSEEVSDENGIDGGNMSDKKGGKSDEVKYAPEDTSEKTSAEAASEVTSELAGSNRRSRLSSLQHSLQTKKRLKEKEKGLEVRSLHFSGRQEVPHHSKEVLEEEVERRKEEEAERNLQVKRLQMMTRRDPEEMREGGEEEGSTSRKTEDPEIESLAAIESELENVAQKLHELRRG